jgi:hypothetical protein
MKKHVILSIFLFLCTFSFSQQGDGGNPKSTDLTLNSADLQEYTFASPIISVLQAEDLVTDAAGTGPWRFGFNNETNLTMENSGSWITLPNGAKIWRVRVTCENALTVNLTFANVAIPEGNELYVYNPKKDFILGKFTAYHLYEGELGSELIPGNSAIVEYYIPAQNAQIPVHLTITKVTHGYRTAAEFVEKAFGSSGSCNMNVNCPDGLEWVNERNSAVMLVSGSSGFCSGALINNTLNDGKPYVLTANHCYSNPATWIFRFNWQANGCTNGTNPTFQSLSGAVLRSRRTPSDFCLVEITGGLVNNTVPAAYSPFFSGWDKSGVIPSTTVCIHHPSGDIKKIAFDDAPAIVSQQMGSTEANSTWTVEWDRNTTTEGGSSGSPLFDQNHRIIGQLWGGGASCSNLSSPDYYGRVSSSWEPNGSNNTNQLKNWLDPSNSGSEFINGYDPFGAPPLALDAGITNPIGVSGTICSGQVSPQITITNSGTNTLTSATINYGFNGVMNQTFAWSGALSQWQTALVTLPTSNLTSGTNTFNAIVVNPNGATDENLLNNTTSSTFTTVVNGNSVSLNLNLDCWGSETTWELSNASNVVLYSGSGYANAQNPAPIAQSFCLDYGCYNFKIMDSYGDGMNGSSCTNGPGSYQILFTEAVIAELTEAQADFGTSNTKNFCLNLGLDENSSADLISVYPNPADEFVTISANDLLIEKIELVNITGQVISAVQVASKQIKMDLSAMSSGVYFLKIYTENNSATKQLVVH